MENTCIIKQFTFNATAIQCKTSVWCSLTDWLIGPNQIICMIGDEKPDWMDREWKCYSDKAYVFDMLPICGEDMCPSIKDCIVEYDLSSTIFAVLGLAVLMITFMGVLVLLYFIMFISPAKMRMPYISRVYGKPTIVFKSLEEARSEFLNRDKAV